MWYNVIMRKKKEIKIVIKTSDIKVSIGHQHHQSGGGVHDNRPRKMRTRAAEKKAAIRDFY